MSKNSLILVLQNKQENSTIDMAKIQIKSEKLTPFGGIFSIIEQFDSTLSSIIDSTLGLRSKQYGYQYSEIIRSLTALIRNFYKAIIHRLDVKRFGRYDIGKS